LNSGGPLVFAGVVSIQPQASPWSFGIKVRRVLWSFVQGTLFRWSFHNWYAWRRLLLCVFGAELGEAARVRPSASIEMPWNLRLGAGAVVGDGVKLYCLGQITVGRRATLSQYAHLCAGTHDYTRRSFPLVTKPIVIGEEAWVATDAFIGPGVTVGDRAVVGARAVVVKDVPPDMVVAGNPAKVIKRRELRDA
jgi:putative colanic acid biosynthesis acetyltransferase WcaF